MNLPLYQRLLQFILVIQVPLSLVAQKEIPVDSLLQAGSDSELSDSLRCDAYRRLSNYYIDHGVADSTFYCLDRIQKISQEGNYGYGRLLYHYWKGYYHFRKGEHQTAIEEVLKSGEIGRQINRPNQEAQAYSRVSLSA